MTVEELKLLLAADESDTVEVKETTGQRGDACETLCAFLNTKGGIVVFGVKGKKLIGQLMADSTKRQLFEAFQKFEPTAEIEVEYVPVNETHTAIVCKVDKGNCRPYVYDGKPYKRVQSSTTVMGQEEYDRMLAERGGFRSKWESVQNPELSVEDLDVEQVKETARRAVRCGRLDADTDTENVEGLLDGFKLRKGGVLLNGAAVLFGRSEAIDYPQLELKMGWFKGNDDLEFLDNRHVQGHIFKLLEEAMAFCFKHLNLSAKINGKIERDDELEIPADALREVLINAFAHRDYTQSNRAIYLAIYQDRVEIKNPGHFPADFDVGRLYTPPIRNSVPRNEKIARVLYLRKTIETWGRGLTRIAEECQRVGIPLPETKVRYKSVITVFKRQSYQGTGTEVGITGTENRITGTEAELTGTGWTIIGTDQRKNGPDQIGRIMQSLPKIRSDARANIETVLHEIIADNHATIPLICARTGLALRTINNALSTLREAKLLSFKSAKSMQEVGIKSGHKTGKVGKKNGPVENNELGLMKKRELGLMKMRSAIMFEKCLPALRKDAKENMVTVFACIATDPNLSIAAIGQRTHIPHNTIKNAISILKELGFLYRIGSDRYGHWFVSWKDGEQ